MNNEEFKNRLTQCNKEKDITVLTDEVFKAINDGMDISLAKSFMQQLLDKGLNPEGQPDENDDWICINSLAYAYNDEVLDIARMIFDKCGVPTEFHSFLGTKIDFNYYNVPYVVKLYLLASSYIWEQEETYIKMSENLYEEMFKPMYSYTSLRPECKNLHSHLLSSKKLKSTIFPSKCCNKKLVNLNGSFAYSIKKTKLKLLDTSKIPHIRQNTNLLVNRYYQIQGGHFMFNKNKE